MELRLNQLKDNSWLWKKDMNNGSLLAQNNTST
jgi:hypothetical protein